MSIISFSIVFIVCIGLMLMMMALKQFAATMEKVNKAKEEQALAGTQQAAPAATPAGPVAAVASEDQDELVAVITAAIAASCGAGAKVLSITPTPQRAASGAWRMTGRLQNFEGVYDTF